MAEYINNVTTQDGYSAAATFPPDIYTTSIVFDIGNQPVLLQVWRFLNPDEPTQTFLDENEALYTAGLGYILENVAGFRVRSASPGNPAQLIAKRFLQADQKLTPGLAFTGTINAQGALAPAPNTPLVQVQHNAALVGTEPALDFEDGTGLGVTWTVTDDGPGGRIRVGGVPRTRVLTHDQFTADVAITGTTEAGATVVKQSSSFTPDGATPVLVDFFCQRALVTAPSTFMRFVLLRDAVVLGNFGVLVSNAMTTPVRLTFRETPTAAAHTYTVKAYVDSTGAGTVGAGVGGSGAAVPGFIRVAYDI